MYTYIHTCAHMHTEMDGCRMSSITPYCPLNSVCGIYNMSFISGPEVWMS